MNLLRLHFFSAFFGLGAVWPLFGLAFAARGLTSSEYAWLFALWPLSRLFASPLWGTLADRYFGSTRLLYVNTCVSALAIAGFGLSHDRLATGLAFAVWALFTSSLTPLAEASAFAALGAQASSFGYVRVFGSIGFVLSAYGVSLFALDVAGSLPFLLAALGYLAATLVAGQMPASSTTARAAAHANPRALLRSDVILFWLASTIYGAAHGAFDMYFGPFVRALPGVDGAVIGEAWSIGVACEVLVIWFMPRVLSGAATSWVLPASALIAVARWWLLARATSRGDILLLAPLHGVTFGAWYLAFMHENQRSAEPELRATMQGIAAACLGFGAIAATVVGGYVLERWGGRALFQLSALVAACSLPPYVARRVLERRGALSPRAVSGQA